MDESETKLVASSQSVTVKVEERAAGIGFIEAFMLPNVASYALAFGFFKLVSFNNNIIFYVKFSEQQ